jgi:hypothetical protein
MAALLARDIGYDVRLQEAHAPVPWTVGKDKISRDRCKHWTSLGDADFCSGLGEVYRRAGEEGYCVKLNGHAYLQRYALFASHVDFAREVRPFPIPCAKDSPGTAVR